MAAVIVISLIAWYFCKRRRTGDVHFSVLFQISLSESKRKRCFIRITHVRPKNANFLVFSLVYMVSS